MCDAFTAAAAAGGGGGGGLLASLGPGLELGSGLAGVFGQGRETDLEASLAEINARQSRRAARDALARGAERDLDFRQEIGQLIGSQRAAAAANGLDTNSGTALQLQTDSAELAEIGSARIRNSAAREAYQARFDAAFSGFQADLIREQGGAGQFGQLLGFGAGAFDLFGDDLGDLFGFGAPTGQGAP